jgi:peptidoglycan/xylan/chitin deacetylase (PgdA/CDA1 family)
MFREILQRNKVSIVLFHDLNASCAEKNFTYLKKHYNIISLNRFIQAVEENNPALLPRKALIITFDDGHIGNYNLLPAIIRIEIPVTIFLCSDIVATNRKFWFKYSALTDTEQLKQLTNEERLAALAAEGFEQAAETSETEALQMQHIEDMKPFVNFQSHTRFHPCLPFCSDDEAKSEIAGSRSMLENRFGLSINAISYPNGDYSNRDIELSRHAGYKCGITVDYGFNDLNSNLFKLKRLSVNDTGDINELMVKASGLWAFLKTRNGKKQPYGFIERKSGC